jgi:hypothetical protein
MTLSARMIVWALSTTLLVTVGLIFLFVSGAVGVALVRHNYLQQPPGADAGAAPTL